VPRRRRLRPRRRRIVPAPRAPARDGRRYAVRGRGARLLLADDAAGGVARIRRGRLRHHGLEGRVSPPRRRHAHLRGAAGRRATTGTGETIEVHSPADMPAEVERVEEPYIRGSIIVPKEYVGSVMELCNGRRGRYGSLEYLSEARVHLTYELPLAEVVIDFYDQLKSRTRGYASFDYDLAGFREADLARVDILVGGEPVDALSLIVHRASAYERGRALVERLREGIPRQMFDVAIQAAIGSRVIARETVKARRKDVLAN